MADEQGKDDFQRGCRLAEQGKFIEATEYFSRVLSDCEKYGQSQYLLGCALNKLNRLESYRESFEAFARAKAYFREKKLKIPLNFYYQQGFAQFQCGEYFQSIQNLTLFIHKSDENERYAGYLTRAQIYTHLHYYDKALEDLKEMNQNETNQTIFSTCLQGRIHSFLHEIDEAKECFEMALKLKTNEEDKDLHLGFIYCELGEYSQAMEHYQLALKSSRVDRAEIYFRQGLIHHLSSDFDEAKTNYLSAIDLNNEHSRALLYLSRLYREEDKLSDALKSLKKAREISPNDREILDELSLIYREQNQRQLALFYQREAMKIEQIDLTNVNLNDDEEEEIEEEEEKEEIIPRRILHPDLIWSLEQESNLPLSENRLVLFQQIIESYEKAIESDESPESRIFLSLCQESENDFIRSFSSMKEFYRDIRENVRLKTHWQIFFKEFDEDFQNGKLSSLLMLRHAVLKRVDQIQREIDEDHQELKLNQKYFYERFQENLFQFFIALSITGRNSIIRQENLRQSMNRIGWIIEYLTMENIFVETIGSKFKFKNNFQKIEEKCSLFSEIGDLTDLFSLSRDISRTIVDRYSQQFIRLENFVTRRKKSSNNEEILPPIQRLADFLLKFLIETIRDKDFHQLGFTKNPRQKLSDIKRIFLQIISVAKSNYSPGVFPWNKNPFENDLPLRLITSSATFWSSNEFFRCPAIRLPDGTTFRDAVGINENKYEFRLGTQDDIQFIKKFI